MEDAGYTLAMPCFRSRSSFHIYLLKGNYPQTACALVLVISERANHEEKGDYQHDSIEVQYYVTIPV